MSSDPVLLFIPGPLVQSSSWLHILHLFTRLEWIAKAVATTRFRAAAGSLHGDFLRQHSRERWWPGSLWSATAACVSRAVALAHTWAGGCGVEGGFHSGALPVGAHPCPSLSAQRLGWSASPDEARTALLSWAKDDVGTPGGQQTSAVTMPSGQCVHVTGRHRSQPRISPHFGAW